MQEADEQDTCRICSAPEEPDQPLFHPCKCSGTIRYIHQDCLTTWLAHSKKKTCDVCKHPYSFTKVYAADMPSRLPTVLLIRRLIQQCFFAVLLAVRAVVVGIVWLALLPWATVWTWRMYFTMGDSTAWWISDRPRPTPPISSHTSFYQIHNMTEGNGTYPSLANMTMWERTTSRPFWNAMSADIFAGQIIASLIVLTFVAIFLLREWISQNARPGVFEDEDFPQDERDMPPPLEPVAPLPARAVGRAPGPAFRPPQPQPPAQPPMVAMPEPYIPPVDNNAPPVIPPLANRRPSDRHGSRRLRPHAVGSSARRTEALRRRREKGKGKAHDVDEESSPESDTDRAADSRARARKRMDMGSEGSSDESEDQMTTTEHLENIRDVVGAAAIRRAEAAKAAGAGSSLSPPPLHEASPTAEQSKFEFTFRPPPYPRRRSVSEPISGSVSPSNWSSEATAGNLGEIKSWDTTSPRDIPDSPESSTSTSTLSSPSSPTSGVPSLSASVAEKIFTEKPTTPAGPPSAWRRPPLPTTTLPTPTGTTPPVIAGTSRSTGQTPLASPSLATYRAPEELEGGPSRLTGYFDDEGLTLAEALQDSAMQREHEKYFGPPPEENDNGNNPPVIPHGLGEDGEDDEDDDYDEDDSFEHIEAEDDDEDDDEDEDEGAHAPIDGGDWDDNAAEVGDAQDELPQLVPVNDDQQQDAPPEPADGGDIGDDLEGNVEDDMEGAMEAIGMRGPIYGVVQNAALMVFVLDTAIGLGVWLPFTIGKSAALLSLDPHRFLQILHLPIRAMRIVTDPVVDSVAFLIKRFALPPVFKAMHLLLDLFAWSMMFIVTTFAGQDSAETVAQKASSAYNQILEVADHPLQKGIQWLSSPDTQVPAATPQPYGLQAIFESNSTAVRMAEPYFAAVGKEVRITAINFKTTWLRLALGHGTTEKIFAVILGYAVVGLLLALYLNILTVGNVKSAGRAVRAAVRQQLLVLKVAIFIIIELVIFPLGCGIMLDVCSVWLFPEANIQSRAVFFVQAPLTAMFYHWVAGTMFMYQFAILLAGCRGIMRPGAMWFVKDPQDQNFHPIRDILDRPTLTQLRKLLVSAMMYSLVVALGVGSVAGLLLAGFNTILPLRWKTREPLSDVPIDLLFLHFILPYTMHYFRPRKALTQIVVLVWKWLSRQLRLTSYMFGERHSSEELTPIYASWKSFAMGAFGSDAPEGIHDGTFRRVPASDNVALPREMRATAEVNAEGEPISEAAARLIQLQNMEAEKAKRNVNSDYVLVYIPPQFRYRIIAFIAALWTAFAIFIACVLSMPILLGRSFFKLFTSRDVHDGYSFITGFYLLWGCYIIGKAIDRMDKRRQRRGEDGPRPEFSLFFVKRSLLWLAKISYMVFFLGIVTPILIALMIEFYIVLPIRLAVKPDLRPHVRIVDTWALGLLYAKIGIQAHRLQNPTPMMRGLNTIANNGWTHPDPIAATKEVIGPVTGGLSLMILLPAAIVWALKQYTSLPIDEKFIFMHVYPGIFAVVGFGRSVMVGIDLLQSWSQSIRDKEFLVEMRLRNHEPNNEQKEKGVVETEPSDD